MLRKLWDLLASVLLLHCTVKFKVKSWLRLYYSVTLRNQLWFHWKLHYWIYIYIWVFIDTKYKWLYIWHKGLLLHVIYVVFLFSGKCHLSTYLYPLSTSVNLKNQCRNAGITSDVVFLKICRTWILVIVQKCCTMTSS